MTTTQPTTTLPPSGLPALLVTRSATLAATVQRLTEPGQPLLVIAPDQLPDAGWARCPLILIDADTAPETTALVDTSLGTRKPVLLSARPDTTANLWRVGVALRAEHVACLPDATDWLRDRLRAATRDNTLVITVLDVCDGPHGTALATALATASCAARRDTLLATTTTSRHHDAVPGLLDALPATRPAAGHGQLLLLSHDPDAPQVSAQEIHGMLAHARAGDTLIIDASAADTDAARAATALADLTLLVLGPLATQLDALRATTHTVAQLAGHAHRLGLALAEQRPCRTPASALADNLADVAAHAGWTAPLPTHTWCDDPASGSTALLDLARSLLRTQLTPPRPT
ncbi:MAG: hypothetical protein ACRDRI_11420 [Pseudonocardiaceae bacterium]